MERTSVTIGLFVLRLGAGGLLLAGHGLPNLLHFDEHAATYPDPLHVGRVATLVLAIVLQVLCSACVILGFFSYLALAPIVTTLLVGIVLHARDPWPQPEMLLLYAVPFCALLFMGPGRFSFDDRFELRFSRRRSASS